MKKITKATIKSFVKKNFDNLYIRNVSKFDGMVDMVVTNRNAEFRKAVPANNNDNKYNLGIDGIYLVNGRNCFVAIEDETYIGYNVYNCCGEFNIAIKK